MGISENLKYVRHEELDYSSWDRCINSAENSRVYALSWYLDLTALKWDALVYGDYEYVMPLTLRSKFLIKYLYQPLFCQQLGIFPEPAMETAGLFYLEIIKRFRYIDILLNSGNKLPDISGIDKYSPRNNFLLSLKKEYSSIREGYSKNTLRNIRKGEKLGLHYITEISLKDYIELLSNNLSSGVTKDDLDKFRSIVRFCRDRGIGRLPGIYTAENRLCAAVFFCSWKERVVYLNPASNADGRKSSAMFFLLDNFISAHSDKNIILDFEGSMVPGVARFYKSFGAEAEHYNIFKINRLPFFLRWIK